MNGFRGMCVAGAAVLCASAGALAQQRTLQFDLNNLGYQFHDSTGATAPFPGTTATGTFELFETTPISVLAGILIRTGPPGNPFLGQSFTGGITNVAINIALSNGLVTGGSVLIDLNGGPGTGDRYSAAIIPGGSVQNSVVPQPGAFTIDSLTASGAFSDNNLAGVPIPDFFPSSALTGNFLAFKILPDPTGAGFADVDDFVNNVPAPGCAGLLVIGVIASRRRR